MYIKFTKMSFFQHRIPCINITKYTNSKKKKKTLKSPFVLRLKSLVIPIKLLNMTSITI